MVGPWQDVEGAAEREECDKDNADKVLHVLHDLKDQVNEVASLSEESKEAQKVNPQAKDADRVDFRDKTGLIILRDNEIAR